MESILDASSPLGPICLSENVSRGAKRLVALDAFRDDSRERRTNAPAVIDLKDLNVEETLEHRNLVAIIRDGVRPYVCRV